MKRLEKALMMFKIINLYKIVAENNIDYKSLRLRANIMFQMISNWD